MKKLSLVLLVSLLLSGCTVPLIGKGKAGLKVAASVPATVILDGKQEGATPFEKIDLKSKTYRLQLIPQSGQPWETTLTLHDNLLAVVERTIGGNDQESEGYIMELEKISDKTQSQISVVTIPDPAAVRIDGQPKGFAPLTTALSTEGNHEVIVSSAGYSDKKVPLAVPKGHKLTLTVQLSRTKIVSPSPEASESATPETSTTPTPTPTGVKSQAKTTPTPKPTSIALTRPYVEILDTPTGWLRVRGEPNSSSGKELTKIYPKETYKFLESIESGWYKIKLDDGQEGWISGKYAKLFR